MRKRTSALLTLAAAFFVATSATAGTTDAFTIYDASATSGGPVAAISDQVTYSKPGSDDGKTPALKTYIGLIVGDLDDTKLLLKNKSTNTLNKVKLTIEAWATEEAETLTFHEPDTYVPSGCDWSEATNKVTISCDLGQMKSGDTFNAFKFFLVAPEKKTSCTFTSPATACDWIITKLSLSYAEGDNGPASIPVNSTQNPDPQQLVGLGTSNPTFIKSAMAKKGTTLYTGTGFPTDWPLAATVVVPELKVDFKQAATITLSQPQPNDPYYSSVCISSSQLKTCQQAEVKISEFSYPDTSTGFLSIKLRIAKSEIIGKPFRIADVNIRYTKDDGNILNVTNVTCPGFGTGTVTPETDANKYETPCLAYRTYYRNKSVDGWSPENDGMAEWEFYLRKNGRWGLN